ncbi:MAG: 4Fe-4S binding protein [Acidobacteriota bacterium]|nr:4Fe-4S binding protein [Acidobacteriota bacterium]
MAHQESGSQRTLTLLRGAGFAAFALGLGIFFFALTLGGYQITPEALAALEERGVIQEAHRSALGPELQAMEGQYFDSVGAFLERLETALDAAETSLGSQIGDYQRTEYRFHIAREATRGPLAASTGLFFWLSIGLASLGGVIFFLPQIWRQPAGIKNNGVWFSSLKSRGYFGIALGILLIGFYIALYFFPAYIVNWIRLGDPVSRWLTGGPADRWFFYGLIYTLAILVMGLRMGIHYRHNRYQMVRTVSVSFFQLGFAFLIPTILGALNQPAYDFKNAWPLDYDFFYGWNLEQLMSSGVLGWFILFWGIGLAVLLVPLFAFFFGKRWYCSWVCGCGGLAETLGDPFRHLSDKSLKAWRVERWLVHGVLVAAVVMTGVVLTNFFTAQGGDPLLGNATWKFQKWYGFLIGSIFAGVVGTGFYPLMGNRVWCRFGCPLAAILGIVQRFKSRFRITTNGGQCISCGNCSTYCEMGIDVRWYAQRGQNIVRASCVGCGICAAVCPRGVLRLENGPTDTRFHEPKLVQIGAGRVDIG